MSHIALIGAISPFTGSIGLLPDHMAPAGALWAPSGPYGPCGRHMALIDGSYGSLLAAIWDHTACIDGPYLGNDATSALGLPLDAIMGPIEAVGLLRKPQEALLGSSWAS